MFTSEYFDKQVKIHTVVIRAIIRETLRTIFSMSDINFERTYDTDTIIFEDHGTESFYTMNYGDAVIIGVKKCEDDYGKIVLENSDGSTSYWTIDCEDLTIIDYIGILRGLESVKGVLPVEQLYLENGANNS